MALAQHKIDLLSRLLAITGRPARTERGTEFRACHAVAPRLPAHEPFRLVRQVFDRRPERCETAAETRGTHHAVIRLARGASFHARLKQRHEGTASPQNGEARLSAAADRPRAEALARIEELKRHEGAAGSGKGEPLRHRTRRPDHGDETASQDDDEAAGRRLGRAGNRRMARSRMPEPSYSLP